MNKAIIAVLSAIIGLLGGYTATTQLGSTVVGNDYYRYTTSTAPVDKLIKSGYGSLGSVIVTATGDQVFKLYDVTTTDQTKRKSTLTSSTQLLASFPASVAAGTYTFDATFNYGLYLDVESGTTGTTTITYRQ